MEKTQSKSSLFLILVILGISLGDSLPLEKVDSQEVLDLTDRVHTVFGNPEAKSKEALLEAYHKKSQNPGEQGDFFQGDIILPTTSRNGVLEPSRRWPRGVVPYVIDGYFPDEEWDKLYTAFQEFHKRTCVRFEERTTEKDYISITNNLGGCFAAIGRKGGSQQVNLQSRGCLSNIGTPIHELMHALGFNHEQNRPDRDSYVRVIRENIDPARSNNFDQDSFEEFSTFGEKYDYLSVMHYGDKAFPIVEGLTTLVALDPNIKTLGQREGFSPADVRKINAMYNCRV